MSLSFSFTNTSYKWDFKVDALESEEIVLKKPLTLSWPLKIVEMHEYRTHFCLYNMFQLAIDRLLSTPLPRNQRRLLKYKKKIVPPPKPT